VWIVLVALCAAFAGAWKWTGLREWADPDRLAEAFEPYRASWVAAPATIAVFVAAELVLFPVLVLIFACGVVFGPWLGALYALAGSVASATSAFAIGRRIGRRKLEHLGGRLVAKLGRALERRGVLAVFLVRKIPAPFTLVNLVCGASPLSLRDFVVGTVLGMGTGIVLITVLGGQLIEVLRRPEPAQIATALALLALPLVPTLWIQRAINRRVAKS
jgi:uncharacterized membrane protein YdjX (TVP38/TMEM64 family)